MSKNEDAEATPAGARSCGTRLAYLEFGEEDRRALGELREALSAHLSDLVAEWHAFLQHQPETAALLSGEGVRRHLEAVQIRYFRTLLEANHDASYYRDRLHIGAVHERVGLEPGLYLGAYRKLQALIRSHLLRVGVPPELRNRWLEALEKVICLDSQLALEAYFRARSRDVSAANEALSRASRALEERNLELRRQFERAQEAARIKEEFLSRISHELRTPLNGILGFADLLADGIEGLVTPVQVRSLRKIRSHGERLLEMIDQMLDAAKMAAAGIAEPVPFDPLPIVEHVAEEGRQAAEAKGLAFSTHLPGRLPQASGDAQGFSVSLGHIVENAVKFTSAGSVRLSAEVEGDRVSFAVQDTGPGVPEEHRDRIFNPFHQVEVGDTRSATGLGMGLTLARQALERMGGELTLCATGPEGSTFLLQLPVYRPRNAPTESSPGGDAPADPPA